MFNHLMVHSSSVRGGLISNELTAFLVSFRPLATILSSIFFPVYFFFPIVCCLYFSYVLVRNIACMISHANNKQTNKDLRLVTLTISDSNQFEGRKQVSFDLFYKCSHERLPRIMVMDCCWRQLASGSLLNVAILQISHTFVRGSFFGKIRVNNWLSYLVSLIDNNHLTDCTSAVKLFFWNIVLTN